MSVDVPSMHVLLTGMSATGKSTLVAELRRRGFDAYDADEHGFAEPSRDGRWTWRLDAVLELLTAARGRLLFFAGCSEEQARVPFDARVLLTAPEDELLRRLRTRTNNPYGREAAERAQILADVAEIEPLLRRSADLILDTTATPTAVADRVVAFARSRGGRHPGGPPERWLSGRSCP